jgi:type I restriction enzyme R subunit
VSDEDQLHFANGIADRVRRDENVMAQIDSHSTNQVMHGLLPKRLTDLVLGSITDHEKLSMEILDNDENQKRFALLRV